MPRRKIFYKWEVPSTVVAVITKLCADYDRRTKVIADNTKSAAVLEKCQELNAIIDVALQVVEVGVRRELLQDIGRKRGYEVSILASCMAKNTYYNYKRKVVYEIAKGLSLI